MVGFDLFSDWGSDKSLYLTVHHDFIMLVVILVLSIVSFFIFVSFIGNKWVIVLKPVCLNLRNQNYVEAAVGWIVILSLGLLFIPTINHLIGEAFRFEKVDIRVKAIGSQWMWTYEYVFDVEKLIDELLSLDLDTLKNVG